MSEDQPPKLDYRSPQTPDSVQDSLREDRHALWGLLLGIGVSAFFYCLVPIRNDSDLTRPLFIGLAKASAFLTMVWYRQYRVFAIAILISAVPGLLIFIGAVYAGIRVWR